MKVIILFFGMFCINLTYAQTYISSSPIDVYLPCPDDGPVINSCGTFSGNGFGTGIKVADITENQITFKTTNCNFGSFNFDGVFELREDSICGNILDSISYTTNSSESELVITADFINGSKDYVGIAVSDNGFSYHSRKITITADTTSAELDTIYSGLIEYQFDLLFSIFPNPSNSGVFNLAKNESTINNLQATKITIYNAIGRLVYKSDLNSNFFDKQINLSTQDSGLYFIEIQSDNQIYRKKLVIN